MEWGKQMEKHQENAKLSLYQNTNYTFERKERKTLIIDVDDATESGTPCATPSNFSVTLHEPLIIDKLSDIYLDNFTTFNANKADSSAETAFILEIQEFNIKTNSNNSNMFNKIFIPNEIHKDKTNVDSGISHKAKKLNYICSINPTKLNNINGIITGADGEASMFAAGGRFIAEFVIVARDKE
jgi:hypothetical protein